MIDLHQQVLEEFVEAAAVLPTNSWRRYSDFVFLGRDSYGPVYQGVLEFRRNLTKFKREQSDKRCQWCFERIAPKRGFELAKYCTESCGQRAWLRSKETTGKVKCKGLVCSRAAITKGLCMAHYINQRRGYNIDKPIRKRRKS